MDLTKMLFEGVAGPDTSLSWLLHLGAAFLVLAMIAGWLGGGIAVEKRELTPPERIKAAPAKRASGKTRKSKSPNPPA